MWHRDAVAALARVFAASRKLLILGNESTTQNEGRIGNESKVSSRRGWLIIPAKVSTSGNRILTISFDVRRAVLDVLTLPHTSTC